MGSYTFRWEHPADEVYVTGTFDNWGKTEKLNKVGTAHEKTVQLPKSDDKIFYKFVADGDWKHDHTGKTETDHEGNVNNVLYPADITPSTSAAAISSVAPGASTTKMAGEQPHEHDVPGAFPETPAVSKDMASDPISSRDAPAGGEQAFGVNPLPATAGAGNPMKLAPGEKVPDASTLSSNTLTSNVHDDPSLKKSAADSKQTFGVAPIPATGGAGNPIHLAPGEKVPEASTVSGNTLTNNVKLDKESYEKSDSGAPTLPPLSPQTEKEAAGAPIFGVGPQVGNTMIPESSMPMGEKSALNEQDFEPTRSGVAPTSTTNDLAGQQPIEPRGVPSVVGESQEKAHVDPEAAANPEAVQDKKELESELKDKVPEEPSTSESGVLGKSEKGVAGAIAGGVAAAGAAAAAGAYALRDKTTESTGKDPMQYLPEGVQKQIDPAASKPETSAPPADAVPKSADPEAVHEKQEVQEELKDKVPEEPATSESGIFGKSEKGVTGAIAGGAVAAGGAAAAGAYALRNKATEATGKDPVQYLPEGVQKKIDPASQSQTSAPPTEAVPKSADPEAVQEKQEVQEELKEKVPKEPATSESGLMGKSEKGISGAATGAIAGGAAAAGTAAAAGAYAMRSKATETTGKDPVSALPQSVQDSINNMNSKGTTAPVVTQDPSQSGAVASSVPEEVTDSQKQAHVSPEAAANPEAVKEKSAMEKELLKDVKPSQEAGEPAPTSAAALSSTAPAATSSSTGAPQLANPVADVSPISMGSTTAAAGTAGAAGVAGGAAAASGSKELNAPADAPAKTAMQDKLTAPETPSKPLDSRDVSPMSRVATKNHPEGANETPTVTTGVDSSSTPATSKPVGSRPAASASTPQKRGSFIDKFKGTPDSTKSGKTDASAADSTKSKRRSLFGRIKDKLKN